MQPSSSFRVNVGVGDGIALCKSILDTVKAEIGGAAAQIEMRGVADKR
jgi:hypothetical protein